MASDGTALKALLKGRHLQEYRAFCREYDRVARSIDRELIGAYPSKATFYRWLSGDLRGLPHPGHCRILESMFPGWTADNMLRPWDGHDVEPIGKNGTSLSSRDSDRLAGVTAVYTSRTEFSKDISPHTLFDNAAHLDMAGLSLNFLCQQYPDIKLRALLQRAHVRLLFLDPDGEAIAARNREEGHEEGHIPFWSTANISVMRRLRDELDGEARSRVQLRIYDETIRFNLMFVDQEMCVMQTYLPALRGLESPTFVIRPPAEDGLYAVFARVFSSLWERGEAL